ncbi:MAG: DNA polymerase IV [Lachnospiraceae bacterium]|nr:DNA polymerase IV [Lachnospiraceae bacterium]
MREIIFHVDVNSAFLSWEAVYRLMELGETEDLREIPSAVCGDIKTRHGIILAKSMPAKRCGVKTADTISEALRKCPNMKMVAPRRDWYHRCSKAFIEILREYSPVVEQFSIDEAFMDMTGTQSLWGEPIFAADRIKDRIYKELGFTVNIGISTNKLLAKMASDFEKPDRVHTLFPEEIEDKMWPLPVRDLFFCGKVTAKRLGSLGIRSIGDLANTDVGFLKDQLKKQGEILHAFANGEDVSLVSEERPDNKGYGNSVTLPFDVTETQEAYRVLLSLCEKVGTRLRKDGVKISVIAVSFKSDALRTSRHQRTLDAPTNHTQEIYRQVMHIFDELWDGQTPIRLLGVHTSGVTGEDAETQLNLFTMDKQDKYRKLDSAIDQIREKYGENSIFRATYLQGGKREGLSGGSADET